MAFHVGVSARKSSAGVLFPGCREPVDGRGHAGGVATPRNLCIPIRGLRQRVLMLKGAGKRGLLSLASKIKSADLASEEPALVAWEIGAVSDMDSVAQFLYRGGPWPPVAATKLPRHYKLSENDARPEKKYWALVKEELTTFLCTNDKKYKDLWSRINALEKKGTSAIVLVISGYRRTIRSASVAAGRLLCRISLWGVEGRQRGILLPRPAAVVSRFSHWNVDGMRRLCISFWLQAGEPPSQYFTVSTADASD